MKRLIPFILLVLCFCDAKAGHITSDEALVLAQDFMQGKAMRPALQSSAKASVRGGTDDESYYIFNAAGGDGYVIIAADDRVSPVLGFSDQGNINLDDLPQNMEAWLEYYDYQIKSLKSDATPNNDESVSWSEVKPLIDTQWGQYSPYNLLCPEYDEQQSVAGCVAVSLAQVMYYYKWPVGQVDSIPGYINRINSMPLEGLPPTTFKWDLIKPSYARDQKDESAYAIAELMRYCGQATEMSYSADGSDSDTERFQKALTDYFMFSKLSRTLYKYSFSNQDWDELIHNELASGRPVIYTAMNNKGYAHCFICDGYKDGYFHFDWGWHGQKNGYFKLSLLNDFSYDSYDEYSYIYDQSATIGIQPELNGVKGTSFTDDCYNYTILSEQSVMVKAIDGKDYHGIDTLWIPDHVDYGGNRYYVTRLGKSENLNYGFKKVHLPSTLRQIDSKASFLQTIQEFTIPHGVEMLSSTAFCDNKSLERFITEDSDNRYKVIDGVLFSHDAKEIISYPQGRKDTCYTVPDGTITIGASCFAENTNLTNVILPDGVTDINGYAFQFCSALRRITLPESLKNIGECAFQGCVKLSGLVFPDNLSNISCYSFKECSSLKSIILPGSLYNYLQGEVFSYCSSLESVYIPSSIKFIGDNCFKGCTALKEITIESYAPQIISYNPYHGPRPDILFDDTVYENTVLKVSADKIDLFSNSDPWSGFKHINAIPSCTVDGVNYNLNEATRTAVVSPGKEPYSGDIRIPSRIEYDDISYTVKSMQTGAFAYCPDLESVVIDAPFTYLPDSLFNFCSSLKKVELNNHLRRIGNAVFRFCSSLESINIPQGVESIEPCAFFCCSSLRSVTIPESVKRIEGSVFYFCENLDSVTILGDLLFIPEYAFYYCENLTYVSIPESIVKIENNAFEGCIGLKTINIPDNVSVIQEYAFGNCISLTEIRLPKNIKRIEEYSFANCMGAKKITIPEGINTIERSAFSQCESLDSIVIPHSIERINHTTFDACHNLKSVILPESIVELAKYSFVECYSLNTITIPSKVREIKASAFEDCANLTSVYCKVEDPGQTTLGEDAFKGINEDCILYVPQGCVQTYRADGRWTAFSDIREFDATAVGHVAHQIAVPVEYYSLSGTRLPAPQQGINIIRYSDGTVHKVTW